MVAEYVITDAPKHCLKLYKTQALSQSLVRKQSPAQATMLYSCLTNSRPETRSSGRPFVASAHENPPLSPVASSPRKRGRHTGSCFKQRGISRGSGGGTVTNMDESVSTLYKSIRLGTEASWYTIPKTVRRITKVFVECKASVKYCFLPEKNFIEQAGRCVNEWLRENSNNVNKSSPDGFLALHCHRCSCIRRFQNAVEIY